MSDSEELKYRIVQEEEEIRAARQIIIDFGLRAVNSVCAAVSPDYDAVAVLDKYSEDLIWVVAENKDKEVVGSMGVVTDTEKWGLSDYGLFIVEMAFNPLFHNENNFVNLCASLAIVPSENRKAIGWIGNSPEIVSFYRKAPWSNFNIEPTATSPLIARLTAIIPDFS